MAAAGENSADLKITNVCIFLLWGLFVNQVKFDLRSRSMIGILINC